MTQREFRYQVLTQDEFRDARDVESAPDWKIRREIRQNLLERPDWIQDVLLDVLAGLSTYKSDMGEPTMLDLCQLLSGAMTQTGANAAMNAGLFLNAVEKALKDAASREAEKNWESWVQDAVSYARGEAA